MDSKSNAGRNPRPQTSKHPLVDAGLHWKNKDGEVINQATILDVIPSGCPATGDMALIQYLDWAMGDPSTRRLIPLAEMASSEQWVLYSSVEDMKDHYERVDAHRNDHIRKQREQKKGTEERGQ